MKWASPQQSREKLREAVPETAGPGAELQDVHGLRRVHLRIHIPEVAKGDPRVRAGRWRVGGNGLGHAAGAPGLNTLLVVCVALQLPEHRRGQAASLFE